MAADLEQQPKPTAQTTAAAAGAPPHPLALPPTLNLSPDSVNALTDLARTVERVRAGLDMIGSGQQSLSATTTTTTTDPTGQQQQQETQQQQTQQQQQQQQQKFQQWLSSKDVPTATDELKHKFTRARAQVRLLPDIGRTVGQQEAEIRALTEKIEKQRQTLETLRNSTAGVGGRDEV